MPTMMRLGDIILGIYEIVDLIGCGGEAMLAKAVDVNTRQLVAVKHLSASPDDPNYTESLARFERAAQLRIGHPAVVDPINCGEEDGEHYLIMPFIESVDLGAHVRSNGGKLSVEAAMAIADTLADGLTAIHARGVVHRDLKPQNILIKSDNQPCIVDLGICRDTSQATITQGSGFLGTLEWMSPEQIAASSRVDHRTDLYALGAVSYFAMTGRPPAQGHDVHSIIVSILQQTPPSPRQLDASIPLHVDQACMRLLAKQPEARFQTAQALRDALSQPGQPQANGRHCTSCGITLQHGARFCHGCGANLGPSGQRLIHCLACGALAGGANACTGCGRSFSERDHRLEFGVGALTGVVFRIPEGIYEVGRASLLPRDSHISRRHLRVACSNGTIHVQDAGSANRTYVAGQLADRPTPLCTGQTVTVAGNTATYLINQ
jgi:serine/threonine protein kinase